MLFIFAYLLILISSQTDQLLTINPSVQRINYTFANNLAGLSFDWSIRNIINNTIFNQLISNFIIQNDRTSALNIAIRPSLGSGYKCDSSQTYCINNISAQDLAQMSAFYKTYTAIPITFAGLQFQRINNTQILSFMNDLNNLTSVGFIYEFGQNVDNYVNSGFRTSGYDMNSYLAQIQNFMNTASPVLPKNRLNFAGPGINVNSRDWMNNMSLFFNFSQTNKYTSIFTIKMNYFENDTDCTINNLLSEKYLNQRYQDIFGGYEYYIRTQNLAINPMKIHPFQGIDTVTNSFAATIWALDFIITWYSMGGYAIHFDCNLSSTNYQSPITSSSNFTISSTTKVNSIYYALYSYSLFSYNLNTRGLSISTVSNNLKNYNIKVWTATDRQTTNLIILNKDTTSNLSGKIRIIANNYTLATYFYISAATLLDTSNFTIMGYTFDNTNTGIPSSITGNQTIFNAYPDQTGAFNIPLSYSQILIVYLPYQYPLTTNVGPTILYGQRLIQLGILLFLLIMI